MLLMKDVLHARTICSTWVQVIIAIYYIHFESQFRSNLLSLAQRTNPVNDPNFPFSCRCILIQSLKATPSTRWFMINHRIYRKMPPSKSIHKSISPTVRNGATWSMSLAWFCQLACNLPSVLLQLLNDRARKPFSNFRNQRSLLRVNIPFITKNEEWTYRACMYSRQPRVLFP